MNEENLITYYNKFNEDKRLTRRHGIIEYRTATKYIHEYLNTMDNPKIIDIGAGTGAYSIPLANEGYDVTAVELIKHNLMTLRKNSDKVKAYLGNAIDLHKFKDNTFDIVTPILIPVKEPGPFITAILLISLIVIFESFKI